MELEVSDLDDSFDEKLILAAWNNTEFLGKYQNNLKIINYAKLHNEINIS